MGKGLMLVGVQRSVLDGESAIEGAVSFRQALSELLDRARQAGVPIVHVKHDGRRGDPDEPHTNGWELVFPPLTGEPMVRTDAADTFESNPALADVLHAMGVVTLVVVGLQSERGILGTSRGALARGFEVLLPWDGHATFDDAEPAAEISLRVTEQLVIEGAGIIDLAAADFTDEDVVG
jgi:nicotinamidase-related amidase